MNFDFFSFKCSLLFLIIISLSSLIESSTNNTILQVTKANSQDKFPPSITVESSESEPKRTTNLQRTTSGGYMKPEVVRKKSNRLDIGEINLRSPKMRHPKSRLSKSRSRSKSPNSSPNDNESIAPKAVGGDEIWSVLTSQFPNLVIRCDWDKLNDRWKKYLLRLVKDQSDCLALLVTQFEYFSPIDSFSNLYREILNLLTRPTNVLQFDEYVQKDFLLHFTQSKDPVFTSRMKSVIRALLLWSENNVLTTFNHKDAMMFVIVHLANQPKFTHKVVKSIYHQFCSNEKQFLLDEEHQFESYEEILSLIRHEMYLDLTDGLVPLLPAVDKGLIHSRVGDKSLNLIGKLAGLKFSKKDPALLLFWISWGYLVGDEADFSDLRQVGTLFAYQYPCGFFNLEECAYFQTMSRRSGHLLAIGVIEWVKTEKLLVPPQLAIQSGVKNGDHWRTRLAQIFDILMRINSRETWSVLFESLGVKLPEQFESFCDTIMSFANAKRFVLSYYHY